MQDVTIAFTRGPMQGTTQVFEVGKVLIGRLPGQGELELKQAEESVSRVHAELEEVEGQILLENKSPNGTLVAGKRVFEKVVLESGATVEIGQQHQFTVEWTSFIGVATGQKKTTETKASESKGALSSPVVRAMIAVYLVALVGLVIWATDTDSEDAGLYDWSLLGPEYQTYQPEGVSQEVLTARAERAQLLLRELSVLKAQGRTEDVESACREIMSLDKDVDSPLFQFGAACLGSRY